jgi:hypothetical protein
MTQILLYFYILDILPTQEKCVCMYLFIELLMPLLSFF